MQLGKGSLASFESKDRKAQAASRFGNHVINYVLVLCLLYFIRFRIPLLLLAFHDLLNYTHCLDFLVFNN